MGKNFNHYQSISVLGNIKIISIILKHLVFSQLITGKNYAKTKILRLIPDL